MELNNEVLRQVAKVQNAQRPMGVRTEQASEVYTGQAEEVWQRLQQKTGELDDEDLNAASITGGCGSSKEEKCPKCGCVMVIENKILNYRYRCPGCFYAGPWRFHIIE